MAFNPVDYYHLASWMYQQTISYNEALARAVISKSYYGAFLEARNKAGITDTSAGVHKKVHDHYFHAGFIALANRLDASRVSRNQADYDTATTITAMQSGNALKQARRILLDLGITL